ncbi:TPA: DUF1445 domain-containing protein [Candidatus Latescibacteria bacterium]|nr:DUF1445 domain-containing protein [Candidatus Latescibacterota bacterium]
MVMVFESPLDVRLACRANELQGFASRALPGYLCVNVAFLDVDYADDFEAFCRANPKPCPLIARLDSGQADAPDYAQDLDIRTDLGSYDIVRHGEVTEQRRDIVDLFDDRTVSFLIGSSVSFDGLLRDKGYPAAFGPTIQLTEQPCEPVGPFKGNIAVTIRAFDPSMVDNVWEFTSHFPGCHGAPVGKNNADELGIPELNVNMNGQLFEVPDGTDRLYWACGITPRIVAEQAKLPFMISYTPGHAMITDIPTESLYRD